MFIGSGRILEVLKGILIGLNGRWLIGSAPPKLSSPNDEKLKLIPLSSPDRGVNVLFSFLFC